MAPVFFNPATKRGKAKEGPDVMDKLDDSINDLRRRMLFHIGQPDLSHDDILNAFAPKEDREILKRAREVAAVQGNRKYFETPWLFHIPAIERDISLTIWFNDTPSSMYPLIPITPMLQPDANPKVVEIISAWVNTQVRVLAAWNRVKLVLKELNWAMDTPEQMYFMWPVVLPLCTMQPKLKEVAKRLNDAKPLRNIPQLNMDLRIKLRKTLGTVTGALLLSEETDDEPVWPVQLSIDTGISENLQRVLDMEEEN